MILSRLEEIKSEMAALKELKAEVSQIRESQDSFPLQSRWKADRAKENHTYYTSHYDINHHKLIDHPLINCLPNQTLSVEK